MTPEPIDTLETEIVALRRLIRRVLSLASDDGDDDDDDIEPEARLNRLIRALHSLSEAYGRLGSLLKTQKDLQGGTGGLEADLKKALERFHAEYGKKSDRGKPV